MRQRQRIKLPDVPDVTRAEVVSVIDLDNVFVRFHLAPAEELFHAELGIPGYEARAGDRVVVSKDENALLVVGVLGEARRRGYADSIDSHLLLRRDGETVELSVPDGSLVLTARDGVSVVAPNVEVAAGRLQLRAERLVEQTEETHRHAEKLAQSSAGRSRTVVAGTCEIQSARTVIVSDEDTVIDGQRVLLG